MVVIDCEGQSRKLANVVRSAGDVGPHAGPAVAHKCTGGGKMVGCIPSLETHAVKRKQRCNLRLPLVGRFLRPFGHDERLVLDLPETAGENSSTGLVHVGVVADQASGNVVAAGAAAKIIMAVDCVHRIVGPEIGRRCRRPARLPRGSHRYRLVTQLAQPLLSALVVIPLEFSQKANEVTHSLLFPALV